ncbi:hypothetical protein [Polyangium jinanense]|uniref:PepSY domain-containing protein n=1 Tax=Polyangium jinanense TaxID=2829994 RepID=A0A9X4AXU6_9BACT|nr:hypothetical protein [Polyangium jinanense]MDC3959625.1 hypothetical protein [Polyangium jinanense]MDC3986527.1 hypothetical protein [Polyangium jinanense]
MTGQKGWALLASFGLALVGLPAAGYAQGQEDAKMTPSPVDTGGRSLEDFLEQGKEWEVTLESASPEARDTILRWAAGGRLDKLEMYTLPGGRVFFEAHISKDGRDFEVLVTSDGQTVAQGSDIGD